MSDNTCMLIELTKDELEIINNALNEVCNGIDFEGEFDTRMGCTVDEARAVLAQCRSMRDSVKRAFRQFNQRREWAMPPAVNFDSTP